MEDPQEDASGSVADDFRRVAREMRAGVELAVGRAQTHRGEVGAAVEDAAHQFFRQYLPRRFSVGRGFIRDRTGRRSRHCDLVINDDDVLPPLPYAERRSLYLAESVAAVIEVKKTLDTAKLRQCVERARDVKTLRRARVRDTLRIMSRAEQAAWDIIPYFAFALDTKLDLPTAGACWQQFNASLSVPESARVDAFAVLDLGLLLWVPHEGDDLHIGRPGEFRAIREVALEAGEDTLLLFFAHVLQRLPKIIFAPPDLQAYFPTSMYTTYGQHTIPLQHDTRSEASGVPGDG